MIWRDTFLVKFILCVVALVTRAFHTHYVPKIRCKGRYGPLYTMAWSNLIALHASCPSHTFSRTLSPSHLSSSLSPPPSCSLLFKVAAWNFPSRKQQYMWPVTWWKRSGHKEDAEVEKYQLTRRHKLQHNTCTINRTGGTFHTDDT